MTRIARNPAPVAELPSARPTQAPTRASVKSPAADQVVASGKNGSAAGKLAELEASIPADLIGHGSDGEPFFTLGALKARGTEAQVLAELGRKLFSKRSETADTHAFLGGGPDQALRAFSGQADTLRANVPEESLTAFDEAVAKATQLFFNTTLFADVRAVATTTTGPQYGRNALTLLGQARTGEWLYVALQIVG